jgi:hypothetical protein
MAPLRAELEIWYEPFAMAADSCSMRAARWLESWLRAADGPEIVMLSFDPELPWPRTPPEEPELPMEFDWPVSAGLGIAESRCSLMTFSSAVKDATTL